MEKPFTRSSLSLVLLAAIVHVYGCGGGDRPASPQTSEAPIPSVGARVTEKAPIQEAGELKVVLRPEIPGAGDTVEALLIGNDGHPGWRWERNGETIEGITGPHLGKGVASRGDRLRVIATVRGREVAAEVRIVNTPPKVESVMFTPGRIYRGSDITATPKSIDADGDEVRYRYRWSINGEDIPGNDSPTLKGEKLKKGDTVAVAVTASDGDEEGETYATRTTRVQNAPPVFVSTPPLSFEGPSYSYKAIATDPDGDALVYSLLSAPKGMVIDGASGNIQWPVTPESAGTHVIEIAVKDEEGLQATQKFSLTLTVPSPSEQQSEPEKK